MTEQEKTSAVVEDVGGRGHHVTTCRNRKKE